MLVEVHGEGGTRVRARLPAARPRSFPGVRRGRMVTRAMSRCAGLRPAAVSARPPRRAEGRRERGARRARRLLGRHAGRPDARGRGAGAGRRRVRRHRLPGHDRKRSRTARLPRPGSRGDSAARSPPTRWSRASAPRSWWRRCRARCRCATRPATSCCTPRRRTPPTRWARRSPACARCRCRSTNEWHIDLARGRTADADRGARAVAQRPVEPHRRHRHARARCRASVAWARERGHHRGERRVLRRVHLRRDRRAGRAGHRALRRARRRARGAFTVEAIEHGRACAPGSSRATASSSPISARSASTAG